MTLRERITADLLSAMKAKEEIKLGALRMLKSAIMKAEVSGNEKHDATDEEVMQLIGREVKQRKDSIDAFRKGDREELAKKEEAEMAVLMTYLPAQMGEAEVREIVAKIISQSGAVTKADMGKIMGAVMKEVKGKADGGLVNRVVGAHFS